MSDDEIKMASAAIYGLIPVAFIVGGIVAVVAIGGWEEFVEILNYVFGDDKA